MSAEQDPSYLFEAIENIPERLETALDWMYKYQAANLEENLDSLFAIADPRTRMQHALMLFNQ